MELIRPNSLPKHNLKRFKERENSPALITLVTLQASNYKTNSFASQVSG